MLEFIKRKLGMKKERWIKPKEMPFLLSNFPKKGWTIKNPAFAYHGSERSISWVKVADFQANGTDQFLARLLPNGLFNYNGLRLVEFANCGSSLKGAKEVKKELESFVDGLEKAEMAIVKVNHNKKIVPIDLKKIPFAEMPTIKTVGPVGGKRNGYDDELHLSPEEMKRIRHEFIVN